MAISTQINAPSPKLDVVHVAKSFRTADGEMVHAIGDAELRGKSLAERLHSGAAGMDQRAVNIK